MCCSGEMGKQAVLALGLRASGVCACVTVVMGFAEYGRRRGGVERYTRCYLLSVMRARCCEGKGDAVRRPVECDVSMCRLVVT